MPWTPPVTHAVQDFIDAPDWNNEITNNLKCIVAPASTTVAGLNTLWGAPPPDGAIGRLKIGASPFDFLDVRYDTASTRWISAEHWYPLQSATWTVSSQPLSTFVVIGNTTPAMFFPWAPYNAADLALEAKISGLFASSATGTTGASEAAPFIYTWNLGDASATASIEGSTTITGTTPSQVLRESVWGTITGTVTDYFSPIIAVKQAGTGSAAFTVSSAMFGVRWIG